LNRQTELKKIIQRHFAIDEEFEMDDLYRLGDYSRLGRENFYELLQEVVDTGEIEHVDQRGRYKRIR
jgi:hypothetical protein